MPQAGLLVASEAILRRGHPTSFCSHAWGPMAQQLLCSGPSPNALTGLVSLEALAQLTGLAAALVEGCCMVGGPDWCLVTGDW